MDRVCRYDRLSLLPVNELGYVRVGPRGAELLVQIVFLGLDGVTSPIGPPMRGQPPLDQR